MDNEILQLLSNVFNTRHLDLSLTQKDIPSWDSLTHMDLISTLENKYQITFTMQEIFNMNSIQKIIDVLKNHKSIKKSLC